MSDVNTNVATFVKLLRGMYTCQSNSDRRQLTLNLLAFEEKLDGKSLAAAGVSLLGHTGDGAAVQAYGAVVLKNVVRGRKVTVSEIPLWDLLTWYCNEPAMSDLLSEGLRKLLLECAYCADTNVVPQMLEMLLAPGNLYGSPRRILFLHSLILGCLEPDFDCVDRSKVGQLRRSVVGAGRQTLRSLTATLFSFFTSAGGPSATFLPAGVEPLLDATFATLGAVAPALSYQDWSDVSLGDTLAALLRWQPSQRLAVMASAAVIRTADGVNGDRQRMLQALFATVLECLHGCVAARDVGLVDEILTLLKEVPQSLVTAISASICQCLVHILSIPSIWFAEQVCSILVSVEDVNALKEIDVSALYSGLRCLVVKHQCDPDQGTNPEGVALSQEQLGFAHLFKQTFDSFRSVAGRLIRTVARLHPNETNYFTLRLLSELGDSAGTATDERTARGNVTQRSPTFLAWEATAFMVDHLSEAFAHSLHYVSECIAALQQRQPTDAVLMPLYMNMLSCFWRCPDPDGTLSIWSGTLDILLRFMEIGVGATGGGAGTKGPSRDLDEEAAHRRSLTLLVTACSEHAASMGPNVTLGCMKRIHTMLFSATGQDKPLLYECVAALLTSLPANEASAEFGALVNPILDVLREAALPLTQPLFNDVVVGSTVQARDTRDTLRTSVDILSAVFRRTRQAPYVMGPLNAVLPILSHLVSLLHGLTPTALPPAYRSILELSEQEKQLFLPGRSRQSDAGKRKSPADIARMTLLNLRTSLYQLIGAVCPLVPTEHLSELLQRMLFHSEGVLPIHHVRMLSQKCLLPVGEHHPQLLHTIISLLSTFFMQRTAAALSAREAVAQERHGSAVTATPSNWTKPGLRDDVVDDKQWFYYTKDVLNYARSQVLESGRWRESPVLLSAVASLVGTVLKSGCDCRNAHHFAMTIMDLRPPEEAASGVAARTAAPGVAAMLLDVQKEVFACVLQDVIDQAQSGARNQQLPKDIDSMAYVASGPYVRLVPKLGCCFEAIGVPAAQVEKLHAQLITGSVETAKRRKVKDFILGLAAMTR